MGETTVVLVLVDGRPECAFSDPGQALLGARRLRAGLPGRDVRLVDVPLYRPEE